MLHPVIRILGFVVFTLSLASGGAGQLFAGAVLLAAMFVYADAGSWSAAWRMLRRMRWLFLSLAVVYFWFTPGTPVLHAAPALAVWLPSVEGLLHGALRIGALALMVLAASLLLRLTPRDDLFAALHWLAAPLRVVGVARERLAARIALSLAAVAEVQTLLHDALAEARALQSSSSWTRIGATSTAVFRRVLAAAEAAPCVTLDLPAKAAPPLWQWPLPLLIGALMLAAGRWLG